MPPSKKKTRFKPSHHLHNPHTDPKSAIEQLFLLRRFDDALTLSYSILADLCNRDEVEDNSHKNKQPAQEPDEAAQPQEKILRLRHNCKDNEVCGCSAIVVLVVQILYEMGKSTLATPFACRFYRDAACVPYDIVFVCVNLLVNSLADFAEAKRILTTILEKNRINQQGLVTIPPCRKSMIYTPEQREILMEFLVFHVLVPLNETPEALRILAEDKTLSQQKKEGWTTCLNEIETAKLLKAQELQKQANQNINPSSPQTTHTQNNSLVPAHKGTITAYCQNMVTSSRVMTGKLWTYLRNLFRQSRFGSIAFGIAVVYCAIHLFAALRRRNAPRRITSSSSDNSNNTSNSTTNNNNNNNTNTPNTNYNNRNVYKSTTNNNNTTTTRPKTTTPRSVQHYAGEEQVGRGGVWASMTKLMSDAVSIK